MDQGVLLRRTSAIRIPLAVRLNHVICDAPSAVRNFMIFSSCALRSVTMPKTLLFAISLLNLSVASAAETSKRTAHSFEFTSIEGQPLPMKSFSGKAVLLVNTASLCGFTRQYNDLQAVWERVVLGVPSNDFGNQEPGKETEIKQFCEVNFNVDFPMTSKVHVKGDGAHPFYRWASRELGPIAQPRWNFHWYLISPEGQLVGWFSTPTSSRSDRVLRAIEAQLPNKWAVLGDADTVSRGSDYHC
jgi:glutathione peroxidase